MKTTNADDFVLNELARLRADLEANQERLRATQRRLKATWAVCFAVLLGGLGLAASPTAQAQFGITLASLNTRLTAVETKTTPLSYNATTKLLTVTGANVMIIDGTNSTESTSGLGNLQVGYNQIRGFEDERTGSHNLIVGDMQNYTSSGGLVAGYRNEISGRYATVSGGQLNTASGEYASVSGGELNTASGDNASVSSGLYNFASYPHSSVSGGYANTASGSFASVSGGVSNTANDDYASVSGGSSNTANGSFSSISGGTFNLTFADGSSIHGGQWNATNGNFSSILGGKEIYLNTGFATYPAGP